MGSPLFFTGDFAMRKNSPPTLPEVGFVRLPQILAIFPISRSAWWSGIRAGKYPKGVKIGPKTTMWRVEDIRALMQNGD